MIIRSTVGLFYKHWNHSMAVMTDVKNNVPGLLLLLCFLASGCASEIQAQTTTKISEDHHRSNPSAASQPPQAGVLVEDRAPFKVTFLCSSAVPGEIFAELSWPVTNEQAFSTTTNRLSVTTDHDGFQSGSFGEIAISNIEPFNSGNSGTTGRRDFAFAETVRGQTITLRRNNVIVPSSSAVPTTVDLDLRLPNAASVDPSLDHPTKLLAQLHVIGREFDRASTAPRGTVTMVGLEANVAYRFRLSEGSQNTDDYVFVAPVCISDYAGPRPE